MIYEGERGYVMSGKEAIPPPDGSTLQTLWREGLCRTVARNDERWLTDAHTVQHEADRVRIANELWKTVCSECPVWGLCLRWAVENEEVGIWAGTTLAQRRRMREKWLSTGRLVLDMGALEDAG